MEHTMVRQFLETHDFFEGVTAKLMTKPPVAPKWNPSWENISTINDTALENKYFGISEIHNSLKLYNRLSYYDYPHRTLSGLPTDHDIKRIVEGIFQLI
jgi:3-hydroxyisobutyryl-CoA hydrolase